MQVIAMASASSTNTKGFGVCVVRAGATGATAFMIYDERVHEIGLTMPTMRGRHIRLIKRETLLRDWPTAWGETRRA